MTKIKKVGIWPVGLVGGLSAEVPLLDEKTGKKFYNYVDHFENNVHDFTVRRLSMATW